MAPFSSARAFLRHLPIEAGSASAQAVRFVTHAPAAAAASLNDRQPVKGQFRWRGRQGCLAGVRRIGWLVAEEYPEGLDVVVTGDLGRPDLDFFGVLAKVAPVSVTFGARPDAATAVGAAEAMADEETVRVLSDSSWIRDEFAASEDWTEFRRRVVRYLTCGDSWTAAWLSDSALETGIPLPAAAADLMAMAYRAQHRTGMAETCLRIALADTGPFAIQAGYSLSLLYARHFPPSLRSLARAEEILDEAWRKSQSAEVTADGVLERVMNRNALALVLVRTGRQDEAARTLRKAIEELAADREANRVPLSILCNNLGRVLASMPDSAEAAAKMLREAVELDPQYPEFWFDLGEFSANRGEPEEALSALRRGTDLCTDAAPLYALTGYVLLGLGQVDDAYENYAKAVALDPLDQDTFVTCIRTACLAERYAEAEIWLDRLAVSGANEEVAPEAELLRIETDSFLHGQAAAQTTARVRALGERYPDSQLVQENVAAVREASAR
ncbi:tetratricopeptide repeat protein [Streptomyces diacarni]|uniref:tetratricopeptide repeat protein n=1 Tax=Streptomyces diacarni TaxID=2800381 RepID=UPI0011C0431D|nr:tetratricopeptide repeat protein [Streptomyces diacarni]